MKRAPEYKKLLNQFEKECIWLGSLQTLQQSTGFVMTLPNGNTISREIVETTKRIEKLQKELWEEVCSE